jgi:hypothetical protein
MRIRNLWAVATFCGVIVAFGSAQAQQIQVTVWPDDVPCSALQKNPDDTYTLLQDIFFGNDLTYPMLNGSIFPTTSEYQVWVTKCG